MNLRGDRHTPCLHQLHQRVVHVALQQLEVMRAQQEILRSLVLVGEVDFRRAHGHLLERLLRVVRAVAADEGGALARALGDLEDDAVRRHEDVLLEVRALDANEDVDPGHQLDLLPGLHVERGDHRRRRRTDPPRHLFQRGGEGPDVVEPAAVHVLAPIHVHARRARGGAGDDGGVHVQEREHLAPHRGRGVGAADQLPAVVTESIPPREHGRLKADHLFLPGAHRVHQQRGALAAVAGFVEHLVVQRLGRPAEVAQGRHGGEERVVRRAVVPQVAVQHGVMRLREPRDVPDVRRHVRHPRRVPNDVPHVVIGEIRCEER
mmetsp:Transcript_33405/g.103163  ORF Transcript_33405/g.103163 Transcript_33405/m.103163 type:complete len:320 (-) Transcript_33405:1106-2065(-)